MIDTLDCLPPITGPRSNPLLFGVAEALARLLPVADLRARDHSDDPQSESSPDGRDGSATTPSGGRPASSVGG